MSTTLDPRNPYANFLSGGDPIAAMRAAPTTIADAIDGVSLDTLDRPPAPGKWSIREIVCHLADCELSFGVRLRQGVSEAHHVIQIFEPDAWAKHYDGISTTQALSAYRAMREWNLALLANVLPGALERPITHPKRGEMTYRQVLETIAGHDMNHIRQIEALAG